MKVRHTLCVVFVTVTANCAGASVDGNEECTVAAIGKETGADRLVATLDVPETYMTGAETRNGGISVQYDGCDFSLNAFFSSETAEYVIQNAPINTPSHHEGFFRTVDASLSIWKFSDASGETRFFVTSVNEMRPISRAKTKYEAKSFKEPSGDR